MAVRLSALRAGSTFTPRKFPGTHFCSGLSRTQGHSAAGRLRSIKKYNDFIGNRTRGLPACGIVPQPTTLQRAPFAVFSLPTQNCEHSSCVIMIVVNYKIWRGVLQWHNIHTKFRESQSSLAEAEMRKQKTAIHTDIIYHLIGVQVSHIFHITSSNWYARIMKQACLSIVT
jgi:hypothetical protein